MHSKTMHVAMQLHGPKSSLCTNCYCMHMTCKWIGLNDCESYIGDGVVYGLEFL